MRILDRLVLAALTFNGVLTALVTVLYLPQSLGRYEFPISAIIGGFLVAGLVYCASFFAERVGAIGLPLWGWAAMVLVCVFGGPGSDVLLPNGARGLLLLGFGFIPSMFLLFRRSFAATKPVGK